MAYKIKVSLTQNSRLSSLDFNKIPFGQVFSDHMFIADFDGKEWVNCEIRPMDLLPMHPANMAIHYGQSIFEGMKASKMNDGTPALFRVEKHIERINASAKRLCMEEIPADLFKQGLEMLIDIDRDWIPPMEGSTMYVRPFLFATDETLGVRPSNTYRFMIITCPVGPYYSKPVKLWAEEKFIRAAQGGTGEAKMAGNYAGALSATKAANENGYDQIMWLDAQEHKYVQEAGTMNLMFVINNTLVTPPLDGTILRGITRDTILHILRDKGYPIEERNISVDELIAAHKNGQLQEAFGCGTAAVVSHISSITYRETTLELPPVETREVGAMVKQTIDKLRTGEVKDKFGWVQPISIGEYA